MKETNELIEVKGMHFKDSAVTFKGKNFLDCIFENCTLLVDTPFSMNALNLRGKTDVRPSVAVANLMLFFGALANFEPKTLDLLSTLMKLDTKIVIKMQE